MNTNRVIRWAIVLFLLALLPVMTVALAQEQLPVLQGPVDSQTVDSPAPAAPNKSESESNNTRATANNMVIGDVMGAKIGAAGDVDYFKFPMPKDPGYVLVVIETKGSPANTAVCLEDSGGGTLACNNNPDTNDSFLYRGMYTGNYYIKVYSATGTGGNTQTYELTLSSPVLVSPGPAGLATGGTVGGVQFFSEDVLAQADLNNGTQRWWMFFDGSDVGVKLLTNFAVSGNNELLFTVGQPITLGGIAFTQYDISRFIWTRLGDKTEGTFAMGLKGSDYGLTTTTEKIDAIDGWINGADNCFGYPVSTIGIVDAPGNGTVVIKGDDEDVICIVYNSGFQFWAHFFDVKGKRNAPTWWDPQAVAVPNMPAEDVIGVAYDEKDDKIFLTIQGTGVVHGHAVNNKQIFALNYPSYTWGSVVWDGPAHGFNYNIDAFDTSGIFGAIIVEPDDINILPIGDSITSGYRWRQEPATAVPNGGADTCHQNSFTGTSPANKTIFASYRLPLWQLFKNQNLYTFDFMGTNGAGSTKSYNNFAGYPNKGMAFPSGDDIDFVGYQSRLTSEINSSTPDSLANTPDVQFRLGMALPAMKAKPGFQPPDVALIHLGTNDINKAKTGTTLTNMNGIIAKLRDSGLGGNPNVNIYIAQIIPAGNPKVCNINTFAADCTKFSFACGATPPVETFNNTLATWCNPVGTGNVRRCANVSNANSDVYLVNQYAGYDIENWLLRSDEIHPTRRGECQIALRWYEALRGTEYPNLPAPAATFCNDYPDN